MIPVRDIADRLRGGTGARGAILRYVLGGGYRDIGDDGGEGHVAEIDDARHLASRGHQEVAGIEVVVHYLLSQAGKLRVDAWHDAREHRAGISRAGKIRDLSEKSGEVPGMAHVPDDCP